MAYKHLNRDELVLLAQYRKDGFSFAVIGKKLRRDKSTVWREWKRNQCTNIGYIVDCAEYHRKYRRAEANRQREKIEEGSVVQLYIFDHLRCRWSPEDISIKLKEYQDNHSHIRGKTAYSAIVEDELLGKTYIFEEIPSISAKTIYTHIKTKHPEFLRYFSVLSHKKPKPKGVGKKELIKDRTWIEKRPEEANERKEIGHWEGDTIISGCRNRAIATMAERATGFLIAANMDDRTAGEFNRVIIEKMDSLPDEAKKTSTKDNGPEFAEHTALALALSMQIFFAHPYHSWERPVNERTNRELRRFFPKGTDFAEIEDWELDWAVHLINHKPRKRLGYRTPHEVFHEKLSVAL